MKKFVANNFPRWAKYLSVDDYGEFYIYEGKPRLVNDVSMKRVWKNNSDNGRWLEKVDEVEFRGLEFGLYEIKIPIELTKIEEEK